MKAAEPFKLADDAIGRRIVAAAADCFTRDGFAGTSTAAIAREARTSKRALYERFPNKQALFAHVMHEICSRAVTATPRPRPDSAAGLEAELRYFGLAVLDRFAMPETRAILVAAISAIPEAPGVIEIFWNEGPGQAAEAIGASIAREKREGNVRVARPNKLARWFVLECAGPLVLGQLFEAGFRLNEQDMEAHVEAVVQRLLRRIGP